MLRIYPAIFYFFVVYFQPTGISRENLLTTKIVKVFEILQFLLYYLC